MDYLKRSNSVKPFLVQFSIAEVEKCGKTFKVKKRKKTRKLKATEKGKLCD